MQEYKRESQRKDDIINQMEQGLVKMHEFCGILEADWKCVKLPQY